MSYLKFFHVSVFCLAVAGCASHPLPEDFEGYNTVQIVEHIRCEARRAVEDNAIGYLRYANNNTLADELQNNRSLFRHPEKLPLNSTEKAFYNRYIMTGFAMSFTLGITEESLTNTQLDFLKNISPTGVFSLSASAGSDLKRGASRHFYTTDTFLTLLTKDKVCPVENPDAATPAPNLVYPVTGSIGLGEVIGTFVQLNQDGVSLKPDSDKASVFADTLNFTTMFSGSINPKVTLSPMKTNHNFSLADASLMTTVSRIDANAVNVGMSFAPVPSKTAAKQPRGVVGAPLVPGETSLATVFAKPGITPAEVLAVQAITQTRIDAFLDKSVQIVGP